MPTIIPSWLRSWSTAVTGIEEVARVSMAGRPVLASILPFRNSIFGYTLMSSFIVIIPRERDQCSASRRATVIPIIPILAASGAENEASRVRQRAR
jgi:hypothetical protein